MGYRISWTPKQIRCHKIIPFKQNSIASGKTNIYLTFIWSGRNDINPQPNLKEKRAVSLGLYESLREILYHMELAH